MTRRPPLSSGAWAHTKHPHLLKGDGWKRRAKRGALRTSSDVPRRARRIGEENHDR